MSESKKTLRVVSKDGASVDLTVYSPSNQPVRRVVVCLPAMGVKASYYGPLAEALRQPEVGDPDLAVVTADLRGLGSSNIRAGRRSDFGYREIVELDLPAVLSAVREAFPEAEIFLLGHSLGGQIACLTASRDRLTASQDRGLAGIVLIASCSVHFRGWPFPINVGLLGFQTMAWLLAIVLGYFPGHRVGFGGREARQLIRDWGSQGRTGRYNIAGSDEDYEALLSALELPILAISFTDDHYSPKAPVDALLSKMPAASKQHLHLTPEELGATKIGHFSWVKQATLVTPRVIAWLSEVAGLEYGGMNDDRKSRHLPG